uniref:Protein LSM14-like protein n=1 Tax=Siphoviridae sp. ctcx61 TaxID=2825575 RepID=A0A8S5TWM9_9CAUD|nr:MAG TPA: protein LSM14-like protein [Siphoviridae sp. ctcx61]
MKNKNFIKIKLLRWFGTDINVGSIGGSYEN